MNWLLLCRMLGLLGILTGGSMLFSLVWAFPLFGETAEFETAGFWGLIVSILCSCTLGGILYAIGRRDKGAILRKEALAVVGLGWIFVGILGGLPYLFSGTMRTELIPMNFIDACFESISGFTTTGASVITNLEDPVLLPRSILFWRCFTHWLGGMGIIVLFVAILGQLGAGGKAMMKREVPGPINENVRPRIREAAIAMWIIYVGISAVLAVIFLVEGMSVYDSLCHTFGTMATGGFSTYNASVGHFNSPLIEGTIILFMLIAGTNFSLYYLVLRPQANHLVKRKGLKRFAPLYMDPEYRVYLMILLTATIVLSVNLFRNDIYSTFYDSVRHSAFITVTIMTTTGFGTEDFTNWGEFAKGLLLLMMFIGGCAGSTGGGMKVIRFILFAKIIRLEIEQAFRPNVVRPLKVFGVAVDKSLRHEVVVYFSLILLIFISSWMILSTIEPSTHWQEHEQHTEAEKLLDCASAVASTLNNIGPGLGVLGPHDNYSFFSNQGKILLTVLMLLGRLELFAILVLFIPDFWKTQ
jgi:trk/ktr system potassium uptake protein